MAIGYSLNGTCFVDPLAALDAFKVMYPIIDADFAVNLNVSSVAGSVISFTVSQYQISTGSVRVRNSTVTMGACQTGTLSLTDVFAIPPIEDAAAAWAAGFTLPMLVALVTWGVTRILKMFP